MPLPFFVEPFPSFRYSWNWQAKQPGLHDIHSSDSRSGPAWVPYGSTRHRSNFRDS